MNGSTSCVALPINLAAGDFAPVPYGSERGHGLEWIPAERCHDCDVLPGGFHHPGCDMEECPNCLGQALLCECEPASSPPE